MSSLLTRLSRLSSNHNSTSSTITTTNSPRKSFHLPATPQTPSGLDLEPSWWSATTISSPPTPTPLCATNSKTSSTITTTTTSSTTKQPHLELRLRAENLPNTDILSLSDPYCILALRRPHSNQLIQLGRTTTVWDCLNPHWPDSFIVHYDDIYGGCELMIDVYDRDDDGEDVEKMDFLGRAVISLSKIGDGGEGRSVLKERKGIGIRRKCEDAHIIVEGEWIYDMEDNSGLVNVDMKSWVVRRRGRVGITQFWELQRKRVFANKEMENDSNKNQWNVVYRSENSMRENIVDGYHTWQVATLSRRELNNGDDCRPLRIVFYKRSVRASHKVISYVETSLDEMKTLYSKSLVASLPLEPDKHDTLGNVTITSLKQVGNGKGRGASSLVDISLKADHDPSAQFASLPDTGNAKKSITTDTIGKLSDRLMTYVSMH